MIKDMLGQIVEKQIFFQELLGMKIPKLTEDIKSNKNIMALSFQFLALFDEVSEALHCLPWKPWKKKQEFFLDLFWEELMDIFHFLINCCILSGMSADMIFAKFMEKNKINLERQKNGY